jgi:hypothetical protein
MDVLSILSERNIVKIDLREGSHIKSKNTIYSECCKDTAFIPDYYKKIKTIIAVKSNFFINMNV